MQAKFTNLSRDKQLVLNSLDMKLSIRPNEESGGQSLHLVSPSFTPESLNPLESVCLLWDPVSIDGGEIEEIYNDHDNQVSSLPPSATDEAGHMLFDDFQKVKKIVE